MSTFAKDGITGIRHTLKQLKHQTKYENMIKMSLKTLDISQWKAVILEGLKTSEGSPLNAPA